MQNGVWTISVSIFYLGTSHPGNQRVLIILEYDNCFNQGRAGTPLISYERYNNMSMALNATGRPILYSMCNWGEDGPWNFAPVSKPIMIIVSLYLFQRR